MKKVRLFAVAAAMGMFASTVAAAEPVVSTGYTTTWEGVEEIIKVDVGNKVVAPVTTIKVVKETRTTDSEYDVTSDSLGFDTEANCWTGLTVAEDENEDNYSDSQVYFNDVEAQEPYYEAGYFYSSREEALTDYLVRKNLVLAPGAEEMEEVFYSEVLGQYFADLEEVYNFLEEKGLVETVYDEEGDFSAVYYNAKTITDKNGNELAYTRAEVAAVDGKKSEEKTKEAVAAKLIGLTTEEAAQIGITLSPITARGKVAYNYVATGTKNYELPFAATWTNELNVTTTNDPIPTGSIIVVEENKGKLEIIDVIKGTDEVPANATAKYTYVGWTTTNNKNVEVKGTAEKVTVLELVDDGEVSKLATIAPTKVGRYTAKSTMVWDEEVGSFVKEANAYSAEAADITALTTDDYKGYWDVKPYKYDEETESDNGPFTFNLVNDLAVTNAFNMSYVDYQPENTSDKWLLVDPSIAITGVNAKDGKITLANTAGKDITVNTVEIEEGRIDVSYPAFDSLETLVKVASKLATYDNIGVKFYENTTVEGIEVEGTPDGYTESNLYTKWYNASKTLADNPWSGFELDYLPKNEMRGTGSEACSYVVSVSSEEVTATVEATEVDTKEAGVKTMTLKAIVDGETVATKDVKVVVAPRYERTYVNGKVAVLKAYYAKAEKVLYSEYHYDWANGTYTATFYANDGVTVASTATGSLN